MTVVHRLHDLPGSPYTPDSMVVALTFDDGPGPGTDAVLDALADCGVQATFFVLGTEIERRAAVLKRVAAAGHTIGSHSWSHARVSELDDDALRDEHTRVRVLVAEHTHRAVTWARPTYTRVHAPRLAGLVADVGYRGVVTWSVDPRDWEATDPNVVAARVVDALHPGAIVLLHDGGGDRRATAAAVPRIVEAARARGYEFVAL